MLVTLYTTNTTPFRPEVDFYDLPGNCRLVVPNHSEGLCADVPRYDNGTVRCGFQTFADGSVFYAGCGGNWSHHYPDGRVVAGGRRHGITWPVEKAEVKSWEYVSTNAKLLHPMDTMTTEEAVAFLKKGLTRLGFKVPADAQQAQRLFEVVAHHETPKGLVGWRLRRFLTAKGVKGSDLEVALKYHKG